MLWPEFGFQFIPNARVSMDTPDASEPLVGLPLIDGAIKSLSVKALATLSAKTLRRNCGGLSSILGSSCVKKWTPFNNAMLHILYDFVRGTPLI
jgi:hypothetical protein